MALTPGGMIDLMFASILLPNTPMSTEQIAWPRQVTAEQLNRLERRVKWLEATSRGRNSSTSGVKG